jgi:hypothetical protein
MARGSGGREATVNNLDAFGLNAYKAAETIYKCVQLSGYTFNEAETASITLVDEHEHQDFQPLTKAYINMTLVGSGFLPLSFCYDISLLRGW